MPSAGSILGVPSAGDMSSQSAATHWAPHSDVHEQCSFADCAKFLLTVRTLFTRCAPSSALSRTLFMQLAAINSTSAVLPSFLWDYVTKFFPLDGQLLDSVRINVTGEGTF